MTPEEFDKKMKAKIESLKREDKPLAMAVKSIMAVQAGRIFLDGKNTDGNNIGEYVNKPVYINPNKMGSIRKFKTKGKNGDAKFKDGTPHKTGYFENFLEFKKTVGRNKRIQTIDLFLTGDLQRDWANAETLRDAKANKINEHYYNVTLKEHNYVKIEGYETSDNGKTPVFKLSKAERDLYNKVLATELNKFLNA